jgi:hypothetical protein
MRYLTPEARCSFCQQALRWKNYAEHLDKYHRYGAVKPHPKAKAKLSDILDADCVQLPDVEEAA